MDERFCYYKARHLLPIPRAMGTHRTPGEQSELAMMSATLREQLVIGAVNGTHGGSKSEHAATGATAHPQQAPFTHLRARSILPCWCSHRWCGSLKDSTTASTVSIQSVIMCIARVLIILP